MSELETEEKLTECTYPADVDGISDCPSCGPMAGKFCPDCIREQQSLSDEE